MATSATPRSHSSPPGVDGLKVSRYDQVSSGLVATLLVMSFATLAMFLVWLSGRIFLITPPVPVTVLEDVGGGGSGSGPFSGGQGELEGPTSEDLGAPTPQTSIEQSIGTVAAVVAGRAADLEVLEGDTTPGSGIGKGEGSGIGDGRGKGPGGPGTADGIPAYERWEVRMSAASLEEYARQLDFFRVELGVAGGGNPKVEYITKLSAATPAIRVGDPKNERRLRFLHRSGELRQADRQLAAKAGVQTDGRVVFQFYDEQMYQTLLRLENVRKGNRRIAEVRRTIFGVRTAAPGQYEFFIISQQYVGA